MKPIAFYDSSIGHLAIYSISYGHSLKLLEVLGGDLSVCDPVRFVKNLLLYICYPVHALGDEQTKPDEILLSAEDVDKLSNEEIDQIAKLYIDNEPYLYRKQLSEIKTTKNGKQVISLNYGEVEYPKHEAENNLQYLHRLYVIREKKEKEEIARLSKSILGMAHFPPETLSSIAHTLSFGDSISKAFEAMRFPSLSDSLARAVESMKPALAKGKPILEGVDIKKLAEKNAKAKWAPFEFLAKRIDKLIEVSSKSAAFMVESNKTQTMIASEIKTSGEKTSRLSYRNLTLTTIIVILTIIGLLMAYFGLRISQTNRWQDKILAEYMISIDQLKQKQEADSQTIEQLRIRIMNLEKQLKTKGNKTDLP